MEIKVRKLKVFSILLVTCLFSLITIIGCGGKNNGGVTQKQPATITGTVTVPDGQNVKLKPLMQVKPLMQAQVIIGRMDKYGSISAISGLSTTTDNNGKYTITGVPVENNLIIVATKNNVIVRSVVSTSSGQTQTADVNLVTTLVVEAIKDVVKLFALSASNLDKTVISQITTEIKNYVTTHNPTVDLANQSSIETTYTTIKGNNQTLSTLITKAGKFKIADYFPFKDIRDGDYTYHLVDYNNDRRWDWGEKTSLSETTLNGVRVIKWRNENSNQYGGVTNEGLKYYRREIVDANGNIINTEDYNCIYIPSEFSIGYRAWNCGRDIAVEALETITTKLGPIQAIKVNTNAGAWTKWWAKNLWEVKLSNNTSGYNSGIVYAKIGGREYGSHNLASPSPTISQATININQYFDFSTGQVSNTSTNADMKYSGRRSIIGLARIPGVSSAFGNWEGDFEATAKTQIAYPTTPNHENSAISTGKLLYVKTRERRYAIIYIVSKDTNSITFKYVYPYGTFSW